ncbi:ATP synthase mitochondrial F1 complex assembly factor 2 [Malassezia sp. CBS 17886]|nr:ATP synthase mitochondrial F1 complex assembly factor 2 [Malassezia sp. CBS 17886]
MSVPRASVRGGVRGLAVSCAVRREAPPDVPRPAGDAADPKRAEPKISRFWKDVSVAFETQGETNRSELGPEDHFVVNLDKRSLRTPDGAMLKVPADRPLLACLISEEWDEQTEVVKPNSLLLTSLLARAIDSLANERERSSVEANVMGYFNTDAICFHEDQPPVLVQLQKDRWEPLLKWAEEQFRIEISVARGGALKNAQSDDAKARIARVLADMDAVDLASMERAVMMSKSIVIGLALVFQHIDAEQAALAAEVETASQASVWGAVDDSHDVDHAELRRQLASVACAQVTTEPELVHRFVDVLKRRAQGGV